MRTLIISRIRLAFLAAIAIVLTQPALKAQTLERPVTANIPFSFQIGSNHYAPGKYRVQMQNDHIMLVQGASGSGCMLLVNVDSARQASADSKLVFHRYGNHYFLSELRVAGNKDFLKAPRSKAERAAQREDEASNRNGSLNAEVALLDPVR